MRRTLGVVGLVMFVVSMGWVVYQQYWLKVPVHVDTHGAPWEAQWEITKAMWRLYPWQNALAMVGLTLGFAFAIRGTRR